MGDKVLHCYKIGKGYMVGVRESGDCKRPGAGQPRNHKRPGFEWRVDNG